MRLTYSAEAVADLDRFRAFICEHDPSAAARVAHELVTSVERLRDFPRMGVEVKRALPPAEVRDIVCGSYIVRYSVHENALVVLRVWHHFEDRE